LYFSYSAFSPAPHAELICEEFEYLVKCTKILTIPYSIFWEKTIWIPSIHGYMMIIAMKKSSRGRILPQTHKVP
jgi:hypothetical protein